MFSRLHAQFHQVRLDLRRARLRGRERSALRRLGEAVAASGSSGGSEEVARLKLEIAAALARMEALDEESRASIDADRADLAEVASWVKPVVVLRGACVRLVLRHRRAAIRRALRPRYVAAGGLAAAAAEFWYPLEREVTTVRLALARAMAERRRWVAPYGGTAFPGWSVRAGAEAAKFGRVVVAQLRFDFLPGAPALVALAVGWWIASTYTDSHLRSTLRSIGIGSGGTRVVSSSTLEAMSFWLPLLAAALCAYLTERVRARYASPQPDPSLLEKPVHHPVELLRPVELEPVPRAFHDAVRQSTS